FMSEGRYRALLCLVQVAVDDRSQNGPRIVLIDALNPPDVKPIAQLMGDPAIEIVLHAGRQDVAILKRVWRTDVTNVFDTQIAAGERLPRIGQLDPRARAVARELAAWREQTASDEDRPVGSVLADQTLVELAKRQPSSVRGLEQIRGLHASSIRRRGQAILE